MTSTPSPTPTKPALTTIFTPPSSCLQRTYTLGHSGANTDFTDIGSDGSTLTVYRGYSTECFPPEATFADGWVQFSPGLCPSAYSIASMWSDGIGLTETFATCCPWYMHVSTGYYDCGSFPQPTSVVLSAAGVGNRAVITSAGYAFDTPIFIAWQSTDLRRLEHHPTATGSWNVATEIQAPLMGSGSGGGNESVPAAPSIVSGGEGPERRTGLSTGAKAGIGIGVALGVLLVVCMGVWALWRRRKANLTRQQRQQQQQQQQQQHGFVSVAGERSELSEDEGKVHQLGYEGEVFEAGGGENLRLWNHEMPPAEVEGNTRSAAELDAQAGADRWKRESTRSGMGELEGDAPINRRAS